jgi:hypothetical protein
VLVKERSNHIGLSWRDGTIGGDDDEQLVEKLVVEVLDGVLDSLIAGIWRCIQEDTAQRQMPACPPDGSRPARVPSSLDR